MVRRSVIKLLLLLLLLLLGLVGADGGHDGPYGVEEKLLVPMGIVVVLSKNRGRRRYRELLVIVCVERERLSVTVMRGRQRQ